ncbi:MAG: bifunctional folylpolyglutamate synthase/dihydrofolate synthase [Candidatus Methylomirabilales bacterium]
MNYSDALAFLDGLQRFGIRLGLENTLRLVEALGHPESTFRSIHVAGTNGKGSTAVFLNGILRAAGQSVGLYTSPHLLDFRERILVDGHPLSPGELAGLTAEIAHVIDRVFAPSPLSSPTFFEAATALAFLAFARARVDWGVIEVGLGGRSDATNVLQAEVSVITNIGLEHQEHLGDSLESIAAEKAGIIREEGWVVSGVEGAALEAIGRIVGQKGARLIPIQDQYRVRYLGRAEEGEVFHLAGRLREYDSLRISLMGRHQVLNAVTAVAVAELLEEKGFVIGEAPIRDGLAAARWPGRLQVVSARPRILVDGAHNPAGIRALRAFLEEEKLSGRLVVIFGVLKDKAWQRMLGTVAPLAPTIILTRPESDRGAEPRELAAVASRCFATVRVAETMPEALGVARACAASDDTILVTGSLYTAAAALRGLGYTSLF